MDCLFCNIANEVIKAKIVYRDECVVAFEDIKPQAPVHVLIIPKKHIPTINDVSSDDLEIMGWITNAAQKIASLYKLETNGYRLVINCGKDSGQEVLHLHAHLLGGRKFGWPPG